MFTNVKIFAAVSVVFLLLALSFNVHAASPIKMVWKGNAIANSYSQSTRLIDQDKQVVAVVSVARVRLIVDTLSRIQNAANITSELWIAQTFDNKPNAFANSKDGTNHVFISLSMLDLLGDDVDAYAFLLGHEIAHNVKEHGAQSQNRKAILDGLNFIISIVGAKYGVNKYGVNLGNLTDFGASLIDRTFSRDQEREADELGVKYMASAGFDPQGAVRLHRALISIAKSTPLPFLSTHPSGDERIANIQQIILSLPQSTAVAALKPGMNRTTEKAFSANVVALNLSTAQATDLQRVAEAIEKIKLEYVDPVDEGKLVAGCREGLNRQIGEYPDFYVPTSATSSIAQSALAEISDTLIEIKRKSPEVAANKKLIDSCLMGMLEQLDRNSAYLDEDDFKDLQVGSAPRGGIGIEIGTQDEFQKVVRTIGDGPAHRAEIKKEDVITKIDNASTRGLTVKELVKRLRGAVGTTIALTIEREGVKEPLEFSIVRDIIRIQSVKSRLIAPGYAYIKITQFQQRTGEILAADIQTLFKQTQGTMKGIVLDLRDNSGGLLNACVAVSAAFLPLQTLVVQTKGRTKESTLRLTATPENYVHGRLKDDHLAKLPPEIKSVPMVVLVNHNSASGAEIVAAALQDHKRATILGLRTFGHGSIAMIFPMKNKTALKLTIASFVRPSGEAIGGIGVIPDVIPEEVTVSPGPAALGEDFLVNQAVAILERQPMQNKQ